MNGGSRRGTCLGVDLGASSGRVMAGWLDSEGHLQLHEIHRFANTPVRVDDTLCWDFDGLIREIFAGLERGIIEAREAGRDVVTIGIDSWGVDFGLVDADGNLVGPVVHYRDDRTVGQMERVFEKIGRKEIFEITGIQFLPFNTIYQLAALKESDPGVLDRAQHFMMISDLVAWKLTGRMTCEFTNATTTQLFDSRKGEWSREILDVLELPTEIFPDVTRPGEVIGKLKPDLAARWETPGINVVAVATHDTGSAVVAVPSAKRKFAYLSCGTWSLMGTELDAPVITDASLAANFTNEGGVGGTARLLKNIMGLWIVQQCQEQWAREGRSYIWSELGELARDADNNTIIDVDDERFLSPGDMPSRVREVCAETGVRLPATDGELVRCVLLSLARRYAEVLATTEKLAGEKFDELHMVGGGTQNELLCQLTADMSGREVIAGPVEATALGNLGVQMIANGWLEDVQALRRCIRSSVKLKRYK